MPPGNSRAPMSANARLASRTPTWNASLSPSNRSAGPLVFSSSTWSVSSFDHAMGPRSISDSGDPATASMRRSQTGRTSRVSRSAIMYSISTPYASNNPGRSDRGRTVVGFPPSRGPAASCPWLIVPPAPSRAGPGEP